MVRKHRSPAALALTVALCLSIAPQGVRSEYYGKFIGYLWAPEHSISGVVYAATENAFYLVDFSYDGKETDAFFWAGDSTTPDGHGEALPDENGTYRPLSRYDKNTIIIRLDNGKTIRDCRYLAVYCPKSSTSLAHVEIPADLDYPKPVTLATRISGAHNTSVDAVMVEDKTTLVLRSFYYDGSASEPYFLVGKEDALAGQRAAIIKERGTRRTERQNEYVNALVTLALPNNVTVDDIDWFSVYCANCTKPLIHVRIPKNLKVPPGSVWPPRKKSRTPFLSRQQAPDDPSKFANCEAVVADTIQVGWHLETDTITFHVRARAMPGMWTAFGLSGAPDKSMMEGADVAVVYIKEPNNLVNVVDFLITAKSQCSGSSGVCADTDQGGTNDLTVKKASYANGILDAVYSRKLTTTDSKDKPIPATGPVAVVAAQGPTNKDHPETVLYHTMIVTRDPVVKLQFDRSPQRNCPDLGGAVIPPSTSTGGEQLFGGRDLLKSYNIDTFTARIGPTAGVHGYEKITGGAGWGIAWWINDELIPILHVERGKTYKFIVEGGNNDQNPSRYHPFYITDSPTGGGSKEEVAKLGKPGHQLYAGVVLDATNKLNLTLGVGRYCRYEEGAGSKDAKTPEEYKKTLKLQCETGPSGEFTWTPDKDTPNLIYYQCFTHNYLGWKISVTNPGEEDKPLNPHAEDDKKKKKEPDTAKRASSVSPLLLILGYLLTRLP